MRSRIFKPLRVRRLRRSKMRSTAFATASGAGRWYAAWASRATVCSMSAVISTPLDCNRAADVGYPDFDFVPRVPYILKYSLAVGAMSEKNMGSSIDDFIKDEGIFEEAQAVKEVVAWQLAQAMRERKISKNKMAMLLKTSRTQVDRLLDPTSDITLASLQRAALMVGRRILIELV